MKKTSLLTLGLATAVALGAAAPVFAADHDNRWNSVAGAYAAAPGAVTGWYGGQNPNAREHQYTDSNGHTHYYGRRLENGYYYDAHNNHYYDGNGNRYYYDNGHYRRDDGRNGAAALGAILGYGGYGGYRR